jgi:ubiquinone/menaquinone biosynthesis C-methylase UbiE
VSFDSVAPWYRALETIAFGNGLQRARLACLDEIAAPRRVLIVGEGNGRFLFELRRRHPGVQIDCVDASQRMLSLARRRFRASPDDVRFLQRDLLTWTPDAAHYDLVVTHFFLDCFPEGQLPGIVSKLAEAATPEAIWLLADFRIPAQGFANVRARAWVAVMYQFFRSVAGIEARELVDPSPFLRSENFVLAQEHLLRGGLLKSQLWRRQLSL